MFLRLTEWCVRVLVRQGPIDDESSSEDEEGLAKGTTPLASATSRQYPGSSSGVGDSTVAGGKVAKPPEVIFGVKKATLLPSATPVAAPSTGTPSISGTTKATKSPARLFVAPPSNINFGSSTPPVFSWNSSIFPFPISAQWYRE